MIWNRLFVFWIAFSLFNTFFNNVRFKDFQVYKLKICELVECAKDTITLFSIFVVYYLSLILIYVFPNFYGLTRLSLPQFRLHLVHRFLKDEHFDLDYGLEYMIHPILSPIYVVTSDESYHMQHSFSIKRSLVFETNRANTIEPYCQGLKYQFDIGKQSKFMSFHGWLSKRFNKKGFVEF